MAQAKLHVKLGDTEFSAEGDSAWITKELEKFLKIELPIQPSSAGSHRQPKQESKESGDSSGRALGSYLKEKNASTKQVRKFLATAIWLHDKGKQLVTTTEVTTALKDNHQSRLSNPSDCLNKNVSHGYCVKDGKGFYVTVEGRANLG